MFAAGCHTIDSSFMTTPACCREPLPRCIAMLRLVRIVARGAQQLAAAALKACRLPQAVGGADDFKFVIAAGSFRVIEIEFEIAEWFSRPVRERRTAKADHGIGQAQTGGFQMALHAYFELPFRRQPRRVDNLRPIFRGCGIPQLGGPDMFAARTVTPLAVDTSRQAGGEHCGFRAPAGNRSRIGVMAKEALR